MSILTPLKKALGLGSAGSGTHHWWLQRLTAVVLIPLTLWCAFTVASMSGAPYETVLSYFTRPLNLIAYALFLICACYHAVLGLQVVIEDYIHNESTKLTCLIVMKLILAITCAIALFSIIRMTISA